MKPQEFFNQVYRDGVAIGLNDIQASIAAAQSSIESGWGKKVKGNSYFGVKAGKSWKGETIDFTTHETINGKRVKIVDKFRKYDTLQDSLRDYAKMMSRNFGKVWRATSLEASAAGLAAGRYGAYATDPNYPADVFLTASKRAWIARKALSSSPKPKKKAAAKTSFRRGDKGANVSTLIKKLAKHGYYNGPDDGVFGGGVEAAVMHFQIDASLLVDGVAGKSTMFKLSTWTRKASQRHQFGRGGFVYKNQFAIRNLQIEEVLIANVLQGVAICYGPNCRVECYSGGQPRKGTRGKRTGSVRHDIRQSTGLGRAGDFHIFKPDGAQVTGVELGKLGQWWLAKRLGSCGLEMSGGGIHLDNWETPPVGGSNYWTYKSSDKKSYGQAIAKALANGKAGHMPSGLYKEPSVPLPAAAQAVIDDADKKGLSSSTNKAVGVGGVATSILAAKPVLDAVNEAKDGVSSLLDAGPWVIVALIAIGAGFYIWKERNRKADLAKSYKE